MHGLARKIAYGFDWLTDFPNERNNGVYFRVRKIRQTIKNLARARHTLAIFALDYWRRIDDAILWTVIPGTSPKAVTSKPSICTV